MHVRIKKKEVIQTERLALKPYKPEDIERIVAFFLNEEIAETFVIPNYQNKLQYYELADKVIACSQVEDDTHLEYGIYREDILIGTVNDCGFDDETIEIGYLIHPDYQGNGYATEVLNTIIAEVRDMGFKKVIAGFFEENIASKRVMEKCGMHLNDTKKEEEYRGRIHKCLYCEKGLC